MDRWRDGEMEGWRGGGMEGWRDGGVEGWRDVKKRKNRNFNSFAAKGAKARFRHCCFN